MSQPYQPNNSDRPLQLARRVVSATTAKEFATAISVANLTFSGHEWSRFIAECRRLKDESEQREESL